MSRNISAYICEVYSKNITYDIDEIRCGFATFFASLYLWKFDYFCFALLFLILLISIFGGIKESYRWFIFNQAFFDIWLTYDYACENYYAGYHQMPAGWCFYKSGINNSVGGVLAEYIRLNPYAALFLLTASRFFALFKMNVYERLTKKCRIFGTILAFDIIIFAFYIPWGIASFLNSAKIRQCPGPFYSAACIKPILLDPTYRITSEIMRYSIIPIFFLNLFYLLLSIVMAYAILIRIVKQAYYQKAHSQKAFLASLRISCVLLLQTSINSFVSILEALNKIEEHLFPLLQISVLKSSTYPEAGKKYDFDFRLPLWIDGNWGLATTVPRQTVAQIRIFLDAFIVLALMTGYREAILRWLKFCGAVICKPKMTFRKAWSRVDVLSTQVELY